MTITLNLPPGVEARIEEEAAKRSSPTEDYLISLIEKSLPPPAPMPELTAGADVVAYWEREGVIGMWADREDMQDSTAYVNRLRQKIMDDVLKKQRFPKQTQE